jgi:hypothetical protein
MAEPEIPLAEMVRALRRELAVAVAQGQDEQLRFALGPIELELQIEVAREVGGSAGIEFWVVSIGGSGSRTQTATHRITLTLTPVGPGGAKDVLVGDEIAQPE